MTTNAIDATLILPDSSEQLPLGIGPESGTIKDLVEYIKEEYHVNEKFTLYINDCVLPLDENIKIIKQADVVTVIKENLPYLESMPDIRIKIDLCRYYPSLNCFSYMLVPTNIRTVEDLINHIAELYLISKKVTLYLMLDDDTKKELESLYELQNDDAVFVIPKITYVSSEIIC